MQRLVGSANDMKFVDFKLKKLIVKWLFPALGAVVSTMIMTMMTMMMMMTMMIIMMTMMIKIMAMMMMMMTMMTMMIMMIMRIMMTMGVKARRKWRVSTTATV